MPGPVRCERVIGIRVIPEERRDYIQLKCILNRSSGRIQVMIRGPRVQMGRWNHCVHRCHLSVVVKIFKWFRGYNSKFWNRLNTKS